VLSENWNVAGAPDALRGSAEELPSNPSRAAMRDWARRWKITIVGGLIIERDPETRGCFNTSFVFDPERSASQAYRKIHRVDVDVGGRRYRESEVAQPRFERVMIEASGRKTGPVPLLRRALPRALPCPRAPRSRCNCRAGLLHRQGSLAPPASRPVGRKHVRPCGCAERRTGSREAGLRAIARERSVGAR
jgi:hypothetical protein